MYGEIRSRCLLPESVMCGGWPLLKVHCGALESVAPGMAVVLGGSLVLRVSRRRPGGSCGRHGCRCGGYRPPCVTWRRAEGPAGGSLALVKARAAFEGRTHAGQGSCRGESTRSRHHSGKSSARHVCTGRRRFPLCQNSAGDGGIVTGVGRRDSDHSCYAAWRPDAVWPGPCGGVVGI